MSLPTAPTPIHINLNHHQTKLFNRIQDGIIDLTNILYNSIPKEKLLPERIMIDKMLIYKQLLSGIDRNIFHKFYVPPKIECIDDEGEIINSDPPLLVHEEISFQNIQ